MPHSAALLGWGSDVLGFDDARSSDHGFGPRLQLFVAPENIAAVADAVEAALPDEVAGYPTRFGWDDVGVAHHVQVADLRAWSEGRLGFDATTAPTTLDWLLTPQQRLLEVVSGAVFHDDGGRLGALRETIAWYPQDVWLWLLAAQWRRIAQDEAFPGRTAERGDEFGSRLVTARLVLDLARLCFLQERRYATYAKWFGRHSRSSRQPTESARRSRRRWRRPRGPSERMRWSLPTKRLRADRTHSASPSMSIPPCGRTSHGRSG